MPSGSQSIRLSPGATIWCTDGRAGSLSDLVIDPLGGELTHIVVEPTGPYHQLRLVPVWMLAPSTEGPKVSLDEAHFRQLQRVLESDFVRVDTPRELAADGWSVRFSTCLSDAHFTDTTNAPSSADAVPLDECAIRRGALVLSPTGKVMGTVVGFLVRNDKITALVIRTKRHRDVSAPLSLVRGDPGDVVVLGCDPRELEELPVTDVAKNTADPLTVIHNAHDHVLRFWAQSRARVQELGLLRRARGK